MNFSSNCKFERKAHRQDLAYTDGTTRAALNAESLHRPRGHLRAQGPQPRPRLPGPELAKAELRGARGGTATFDWTEEVSVRPEGLGFPGVWGWLVASLVGGGAREEGAVLSGGRGGSPRPCERQAGKGARGRSGRGSTRRDDARTPGPCSPPLRFLYPARICVPETGDQCPLHGEKPPATESRPRETVDSAGRPSAARGRTSPTVLTVSGPHRARDSALGSQDPVRG